MSFDIQTKIKCYLLPDDGDESRKDFLNLVSAKGETWIIAYSFTLAEAVQDLIQAHKNGVKLHLYLDHSQAITPTEEPQIQDLVAADLEVTIGTSTSGGKYICHTKGLATDLSSGPTCWEGSVNFSKGGWLQVNTAMQFISQPWRDHFVKEFEILRDFAWKEERNLQLMPHPPAGVSVAAPVGAAAGGG